MAMSVVENERIEAITAPSGIQLPVFTTKRQVVLNENVPSAHENHMDWSEKLTKINSNQNLDSLLLRQSILTEQIYLLSPFLKDYKIRNPKNNLQSS